MKRGTTIYRIYFINGTKVFHHKIGVFISKIGVFISKIGAVISKIVGIVREGRISDEIKIGARLID